MNVIKAKLNFPSGKNIPICDFAEMEFPEKCTEGKQCVSLWSWVSTSPSKQGIRFKALTEFRQEKLCIAVGKHSSIINYCPFCGELLHAKDV